MRMIPGVVVLAPSDPDEIRAAVRAMLDYEGPVYMRIGNDPIPNLYETTEFHIGQGRVAMPGKDITLVAAGSIAAYGAMAAIELQKRRISVELITMPTVVPIDQDLLLRSISKTGRVATLEEHYIIGGLGTIVQEIVSEFHPVKVKKLGLPHGYTTSGPYEELLRYYGLDAAGITKSIEEYLNT